MLTNDLDASRQTLTETPTIFPAHLDAANVRLIQNAPERAHQPDADSITDLEAQNQALDERATEMLSNTIAELDAQIADTQKKLAIDSDQQRVPRRRTSKANGAKRPSWNANLTTWTKSARKSGNCGTICSSPSG